jgi:hypothetical protein
VTDAPGARSVFARGDRAFAELSASLDAEPSRVLHGEGGRAWTARDVYVHLFRWQEWATEALAQSLRSGELVEAYADEEEMEALNARWQSEGETLSVDDARDRCEESRARMCDAFLALPNEDWARWGPEYGAEFDGSHYRGHLEYIQNPKS